VFRRPALNATPLRVLPFWGALLLACSAAIFSPALVANPDRLIRATDLLKVCELSAPVYSPDGKQVVYTVKTIEERAERPGEYTYRTQLWLVSTDGRSTPRQLTRGPLNARSPAWSPNGDRLAFVRIERDKPQIWILPLGPAGGGDPFPLTRFPPGADMPRWSPDGSRLLFSSTLSLTETRRELEIMTSTIAQWFTERPGRKFGDTENWGARGRSDKKGRVSPNPDGTLQEQREWLARNEAQNNPRVTSRLEFLGEQDLEPTEAFTHLFVVEAQENAVPIPLTPGFASYHDANWYTSPNGLQIIFSGDAQVSEHPDRILERDLWMVGPTGGPMKRLLHDEQFAYTAPAISPDGSMIAFLASDLSQAPYAHTLLCVLPARGGPRRFLTTRLDRSVQTFRWSHDSQSIYFTAASNGAYPLFRVPAAGGKIERLTPFSQSVLDFDVRSTGIAAVISRPGNPFELYLLNHRGEEPTQLTAHNSEWLKGKAVSVPERREISTSDGLQIEAWVMKPSVTEPNRKYPLLVEIHGGPQAMWGPAEPSMWHEFQYFAARGYGIVYCNPRGSSGYGYAFQRENFRNWAQGPSHDVLAAADAAASNGWVDSARQVITGGSYGGYLTVWIISQDRRFKAAVAQRGVYELSIFFGEGNAWRLVPYNFGGYPWQPEVRAILNAQSPLSQVTKISTPLLIQHGDTDLRAGVIQSEMLYKSLKVLGAPVEYVRYPGASHEQSRSGDPRQRIDRLVRMDEFFQRFIGRVEP
jgi:dipeptidyl aminopeptidase/acylaminoacyl peptidase